MSLFPAYAKQAQEFEATRDTVQKPEWLENSSFKVSPVLQAGQQIHGNLYKGTEISETLSEDGDKGIPDKDTLQVLSDASNSSGKSVKEKLPKKRKKKQKKKHRKDKHYRNREKSIKEDSEYFFLDTKQVQEYLSVSTISRPAVPKYCVKYYLSHRCRGQKQKHKIKRYFKFILEKYPDQSDTELQVLTKENIDKLGSSERDANSTSLKEEEEISKKTAFYNKTLSDNPNNLNIWMEYVNFQNTVYNFEKNFKKGSIAKAQRVFTERKISILEKALFHNPDCEQLLRERIKVAVMGFSTDELQDQMERLVEKDQGNIILWQGYIEAFQCSMAHCNTPEVTALYSKCLATLHKLRRSTLLEKYLLEENILKMLYQCGLFLKQTGLFEQLWTLLEMYLELNLSPSEKGKFDIDVNFNEDQFQELEEVIFSSQLPLHELWLRTEKLRESCHFLPVKIQEDCGDPQRIVFTDDVVELIHPITLPENIFKFVGIILTLLKIPLLPHRHSTSQSLGLDYVPWSLDSMESLLPVFFPLYPIDTHNENLLTDTNRLAVGPQYLRNIPGQEEYLNLILTVFENCADCLIGKDQTAIRIWWLRFQRLLIILEKQNRFKMPQFLKKKIKNDVKNFLKREENRNQEIFYLEYALIEKEVTSAQKCSDILSIALSMNKNITLVTKNWENSQATRCLLHRTMVEHIVEDENLENSHKKDLVLESVLSLVLQRKIEKVTQGLLMEADTKFKSLCAALLENFCDKKTLVDHFLPDFFTDFYICYGWFLNFYKGPLVCGVFLENALEVLERHKENSHFETEVIYEFYSVILFKHCLGNFGSGIFKILDDVLFRAIEKFPNNLYLLSLLAKEQTLVKNFGPQWWRIEKMLLKSERAFPIIFSVVIYDLVWRDLLNKTVDTVTGSKLAMSASYKNRMLSLFKKITNNNVCTRRCGLAWRLYLQFVHTFFSPELCRKVYYSAVEECPWLKALYIDAAIYIPAELAQIQDLIIEKQLRLHVTPEELDILRN